MKEEWVPTIIESLMHSSRYNYYEIFSYSEDLSLTGHCIVSPIWAKELIAIAI